MTIIVQKYGGSSLANVEMVRHVAERIMERSQTGVELVVVCSAMGDTTDELLQLGRKVTVKPAYREMDVLLSTGEIISCALVAMALMDMGHSAISLTGLQAGIKTGSSYGKARISEIDPSRILAELDQGRIVIVCGFQGGTDQLEVTTLGRGGSDTTAVALAAALEADLCEIYTDVDGIYTADPRIVDRARKLPEIDYDEMLELAITGAKMDPRSLELGSIFQVPIIVASTFEQISGTLIHGEVGMELSNRVRGVACDLNVSKITLLGIPDKPGIAARVFEPLAESGVSVDTIVQNTGVDKSTDLSFTVSRTDLERVTPVVESLAKEMGAHGLSYDSDLAKISIVGTGMQNTPGYASRMFRALAEEGVNIEMITTSEIRITCIVNESQAHNAVRSLHQAFHLDEEDG